jgi:hypothetical protein
MEKLLQVVAWRQILYVIVPGGIVTSVLVALTGLATSTPEAEESRLFAAFVFLIAVVCAGVLVDLVSGVYEAMVLDKYVAPYIRRLRDSAPR